MPVELPLMYCAIITNDIDIIIGEYQCSKISISGKRAVGAPKKTITKRGGHYTLLLGFTIQGINKFFIGLAEGIGALPLTENTITLRTSVDGKLHKIRLRPTTIGSVEAEVLS